MLTGNYNADKDMFEIDADTVCRIQTLGNRMDIPRMIIFDNTVIEMRVEAILGYYKVKVGCLQCQASVYALEAARYAEPDKGTQDVILRKIEVKDRIWDEGCRQDGYSVNKTNFY